MKNLSKSSILCLIAGLFFITSANSFAKHLSDEKVHERTKPVGKVYLEGDDLPAAASTQVATGPREGKAVFDSFCMACHSTGAAGAPKVGDTAVWAPLIARGLDDLLASATKGLNAMPPKGTCMDCSDDELKSAIDYMISKSQ